METTVSITKQWQIYLPQKVRKAMGLKHPTQAKLNVANKTLTITPTTSPYLKHVGKYTHLKPIKPIDLDNIRDFIDYSDL
jgi:bifunctional DNA-binding transcriptional regulator/antitoxin component of YhaV-PrlF toxin-antitoxin module